MVSAQRITYKKDVMKKQVIFIFFIALFSFHKLQSIFNGKDGSSIVVDTTPSLTAFEWARGFVKFNQGFDITPGVTIFLGINQLVDGPLTLNNGTIILEQDLHLGEEASITGSCFFVTNNHTIYIHGNLNISNRGTLFFNGAPSLHGGGTGRFKLGGTGNIVLLDNNNLSLVSLEIISAQNILFNAGGLKTINMRDGKLNITSSTFSLDRIDVLGDVILKGIGGLFDITDRLRITIESSCTIEPSAQVKCDYVDVRANQSDLFLNNAILETNRIEGNGRLFIEGQSQLFNFDGGILSFDSNADLIMTSGARLSIINSHLQIN